MKAYKKYKDSGIKWIGEIPEHWGVWKISHAFKEIGSGTTPKTSNREFYDNGKTHWINTGDLNDGVLSTTKKFITEKALKAHSALREFEKGALVIAMYGATIGKVSITEIEATANQACCILVPSDTILIKFAFYWFILNKRHIVSLAYGGGQPNISQELIKTLKIPVPEIKEQTEIVQHIEKETTCIDQEIEYTEKEIELLKEYKQSLITEAVTGKIDVRDYPLTA